MAKFIILTCKDLKIKHAVNIDNIAEIYSLNKGTTIRYCSGDRHSSLHTVFSETFEEVLAKIEDALNDSAETIGGGE